VAEDGRSTAHARPRCQGQPHRRVWPDPWARGAPGHPAPGLPELTRRQHQLLRRPAAHSRVGRDLAAYIPYFGDSNLLSGLAHSRNRQGLVLTPALPYSSAYAIGCIVPQRLPPSVTSATWRSPIAAGYLLSLALLAAYISVCSSVADPRCQERRCVGVPLCMVSYYIYYCAGYWWS